MYSVYCIRPKLAMYPPSDVYFGSTSIPLPTRFSLHRSSSKLGKNTTSSYSLFEKYGSDLEIVSLESGLEKFDARERESHYTKLFPCINRYKNHITDYDAYRREYQKHYRPMYYDENRERLLELSRVKVECSCGAIVRRYYLDEHMKTGKHGKRVRNLSGLCINCADESTEPRPDSLSSVKCGIQT